MNANTAEFGLKSNDASSVTVRVQPCYWQISASKRWFPGSLDQRLWWTVNVLYSRLLLSIRRCPDGYRAGWTVSSLNRDWAWLVPPVARPSIRVRVHPQTHERQTTRLEAYGIVDSRRSMPKLWDTRHTAVRSRLRW